MEFAFPAIHNKRFYVGWTFSGCNEAQLTYLSSPDSKNAVEANNVFGLLD